MVYSSEVAGLPPYLLLAGRFTSELMKGWTKQRIFGLIGVTVMYLPNKCHPADDVQREKLRNCTLVVSYRDLSSGRWSIFAGREGGYEDCVKLSLVHALLEARI
jgi:hypothetical protein